MYKSINGLLISNSVKVETECVQLSVNCVHIVFNTVYNSTCTVAGPKPFINHIVRAWMLCFASASQLIHAFAITYALA